MVTPIIPEATVGDVIPIMPKMTVGELAPRRTFRGRMAANRQLRGVAIVAALAVVLAATLTGNWALQADRAGDTAPLPAVVVAEASGSTAAVGDTTVAGLRESLDGEGVASASLTSRGATETGLQEFLAGDASARSLPSLIPNREAVPGFTNYREDHRAAGAGDLPGFAETREDHRAPSDTTAPTRWGPGEDY